MAEAAGAFYAVETFVEGAIAVAKGVYDPTLPLRVDLLQVKDIDLPRYNHTVSLVKGRAYVFGGITKKEGSEEELADNDIHVIILPIPGTEGSDYKKIASSSDSPPPRQGHSAAVIDDHIFVYGGASLSGEPLEESGTVWAFSTTTSTWKKLTPAHGTDPPPNRTQHASVATPHPQKPFKRTDENLIPQLPSDPSKHVPEPPAPLTYGTLIIHGGIPSPSSDPYNDVWSLDISTLTWSPLPTPTSPVRPSPSPCLALDSTRLYIYAADTVHALTLTASATSDTAGPGPDELGVSALSPWTPLSKDSHSEGPGSRSGAFISPITTGQGRNYLALLGGSLSGSSSGSGAEGKGEGGDIWTLQLQPEGMTAASFKDAARMAVKKGTGEKEWAEVRYFDGEGVMVQEGQEGRGVPGREGFAAARDGEEDGGTVFVHGGRGAGGEVRGDGVLVTFGI
ncbi:hypothetical protein KVT40_000639 [Elsinoe batatas]|uniref:Galactose oxidase n=1 Tax=Elsinoe batatas TaxID=2601811 RepID=A0A8K0PMW2_9PEZI|nr:hypothetical protein KVT40_000639 [Elsinoe batatas]